MASLTFFALGKSPESYMFFPVIKCKPSSPERNSYPFSFPNVASTGE